MKISGRKLYSGNNTAGKVGGLLFWMLAVLPLTAGIGYALLYSLGLIGLGAPGATLGYWEKALSNSNILFSFGYSFYIALVSILLSVGGALFILSMVKDRIKRSTAIYLLYLPLTMPAVVTAFFVYRMFTKSGFVSRLFNKAGLIEQISEFPGLVFDPWAIGIITAHVLMATPFFVIFFMDIYRSEQIDKYQLTARSLGAGKFHRTFRITYPLIIYRAFPTIVLYFVFALGSYEIPLLLGQSDPQMVSVLVVRKLRSFSLDTIPGSYIIALLYIGVLLVVLSLVFHRRRFFYDL